jgi:UPF0755 protein
MDAAEIGRVLMDAGLVEEAPIQPDLFWRVALHEAPSEPLKHGTYKIPKGLSPLQIVEILQEGVAPPPKVVKVTIPEGLTIEQMARRFDEPEAFLRASSSPEVHEALGYDVTSLEGFLMPNTYHFEAPPPPAEVAARMARQFRRDYEALLEASPGARERDVVEVVTVASLIEEEARVAEERPLIAAVIYNRLDAGMPLQFDSTLQYALGKYGQRLLDADKEIDSPYNTYKNRGLPPGPISNPGPASLRAALAPADVDYLYFVSNADGRTHTFSATYREHQRAVRRFRREIREQRRAQNAG